MSRDRLFATLALAALPLIATPALGQTIPLTGLVTDSDGRPVAEARVLLFEQEDAYAEASRLLEGRLEPEPAATAATDEAGRYRLAAPGPGMWRLAVRAAGHVPVDFFLTPLVEPIDLPTARLERDLPLTLRLSASDGSPVAGAMVEAIRDERSWGQPIGWHRPARRVLTDEGGVARLPAAPGEHLRLWIAAPGNPLVERREAAGATISVTLPAGEPRPVRVEDSGRRPTPGAVIRFARGTLPLARSIEEGEATLLALPGEPLPVLALGPDGARLAVTVARRAEAEAPPQRLELPPALPLGGRVFDSRTRSPLARAVVWLLDDPARATLTDAAGAFHLPGAPSGEAVVWAAAAGYFQTSRSTRVDLRGQTDPLALALDPAAALEGTVTDPRGEPLAGVEIRAHERAGQGRPQWRSDLQDLGRSDQAGRFRLPRLVPDTAYQVEARLVGFAPAREIAPALEAGRTARLRIVLEPGRLGVGRVVDLDDQPIAGALVTLDLTDISAGSQRVIRRPGDGEPQVVEAETDHEGRFRLRDLPQGSFNLSARAVGFATTRVRGVEVPGGAGTIDLGTLVLAEAAPIDGFVVDRDGQPVADAEVFALDPDHWPVEALRFRIQGQEPATTTGPDGAFTVLDKEAGSQANLAARRRGYALAILGGVEAPTAEPVVLRLAPASRALGQVIDEDGRPVAGARVRALIERRTAGFSLMAAGGEAQSDSEGFFELEGLEPGMLRLETWATGFLPASREIEIPSGADLEGVEIELTRGAVVAGLVTGADGAPVIGAQVTVLTEGQPGRGGGGVRSLPATTDGDGRYRLDGVEPGERSLSASASGYPRAVRSLEVRPGENRLDLALERGQPVSGRVLDPAGTLLADAQVMMRGEGAAVGRFTTVTSGDGAFAFEGVPDGVYRVTAQHPRFAEAAESVQVAGSPVEWLELQLAGGAVLTGALRGVGFAELASARVSANAPTAYRLGQARHDGSYRIEGLGQGDWHVTASVDRGSRRASGRVRIEPGQESATLDLDFEEGLALSGRIRHLGEPLAGASITVRGLGIPGIAGASSDGQGHFQVEGLLSGRYELRVGHLTLRLEHREELDLQDDHHVEVDLLSAAVHLRALDAETNAPVARALVSIEAEGEGDRAFPTTSTTDSRGELSLGRLSRGRWGLIVERAGYASAQRSVAVTDPAPIAVEVLMTPTEGITLELQPTSGPPPGSALVALMDGSGNAFSSGSFTVGEGGRLRVATAPPGTWQVRLAAPGYATASVAASSPGPRVAVHLLPEAILEVRVPELAESPVAARLTAVGADGLPHLFLLGWGPPTTERAFTWGRIRLSQLAAGPWALTVTTPDGRSWSATTVARAGETTEVVLE
jgi:protocatechuate 3,4-dioxygenase beta subunit